MRKIILFLLLAVLAFGTMPAAAQQSLEFDSVAVSIWPEFDNQDALVIYKLALSPKVSLPAQVELKIPSTVTRLWTIAVGDSFETVSDSGIDSQFQTGESFSTISLTAKSRFIQIEFYDTLKKSGSQRNYTYQWNGEGSVGTFLIEVRQPLQSTNFSATPSLGAPTIDSMGFETANATQFDLQTGQRVAYKFSYDRQTDEPSTAFLQVQQPDQPTTESQNTFTNILPWLLGGLGVVFLGVATYLYFTSGRASRSIGSEGRRRHTSRSSAAATPGNPVHCPECGNRSVPGDKFCRTCGAKLRFS